MSKFGYNAAGLEYGLQYCEILFIIPATFNPDHQIDCGDVANITAVVTKLVEQSQYDVPCSGNSLY